MSDYRFHPYGSNRSIPADQPKPPKPSPQQAEVQAYYPGYGPIRPNDQQLPTADRRRRHPPLAPQPALLPNTDLRYGPPPNLAHQQVLPAADPLYRPPGWWKMSVTCEDTMLVLLLTLEGFTTTNISRRLKALIQPTLNVLLSKPEIIYAMQDNIGTVFKGANALPPALMPTVADGLVQGIVKCCTSDGTPGLTQLARAKEYEKTGGNHTQLQTLANARQSSGLDIKNEFGYTTAWVAQRVRDNIWKDLLVDWWKHGTINNKTIPEKRP